MAIPKICLHMTGAITFSSELAGLPLVRIEEWGGSVARASAARVSIIKLIQRSWTTVNGDSPRVAEPKNTKMQVEILTVT